MMTLAQLVESGVNAVVHGDPSTLVRGVRHDSRDVSEGELFVAIKGERVDGTRFVDAALQRGACAIAAEAEGDWSAPTLVTSDPRQVLARASELVYGRPTSQLAVTGFTGTNGKTTCAWLLEQVLSSAGRSPAVMGTVSFRGPGFEEKTAFTTPEADDLARAAKRCVDAGASDLVMEVSSHALALRRADAVEFDVVAFTNLTQDHLDFHGDLGAYQSAKARLFTELSHTHAVVCVDHPFGRELMASATGKVMRVSTVESVDADVRVTSFTFDRHGIEAALETPFGPMHIASPLVGRHNLENLVVVTGCALALGLEPAEIIRALGTATGAPGRLQRVPATRDVSVFVDYAHTPDALENALIALRSFTPKRLIAVFGCGGDRDREKRPMMGAAAAQHADLSIVTSDNPRSEVPATIVDDILPGLDRHGVSHVASLAGQVSGAYTTEVDRGAAIAMAIELAEEGDTVLIAGKGHENYQIIGDVTLSFDDVEVARAALESGGA